MILLAALLAGAAVAPAASNPPAAKSAVDPAALAAARRLITATDLSKQIRAIVPQAVSAAMAQARATFKAGQMPEGLMAQLETTMREGMVGMMDVFTPAMQDQMASAYARHFATADLNRIADLLADPAMVRFRDGQAAVLADIMPMLMAAMQPKQQAFQTRIMAVIVEWLRTHPDDRSRLARPISS